MRLAHAGAVASPAWKLRGGSILKTKLLVLAGTAMLVLPFASTVAAEQAVVPPPAGAEAAAQPAAEPMAQPPMDPKARAKQIAQWKRQYGEGPYPDETAAFLADKPDALKPYWQALWTGGERNSVLNFQRLGLAAMEVGEWSTAEKAFDQALLRIETVYAKDKMASRARDVFAKEANKDFKGEPYERSMAYYYRGLLYLRRGDYGNARASFKGAEFQDTVSEQEEFQSDFAAMNYLIGWSARCMGENPDQDFAAASAVEPALTAPPQNHNVLLIAETGNGPIKAKDGAMREKLVFQAVDGAPERMASFQLAPAKGKPMTVAAVPASSVYYQATTRGGRAMDGILKGKAAFKETTGTIGNVGMAVGLSMMNQGGDVGGAGLAVAGVGALFSMFSSAAKADADIRYWDQLPDGLQIATTQASGDFKPQVRFAAPEGPVDVQPAAMMTGGDQTCRIVWTRSRSALVGGDTPGDDLRVRAAVAKRKDVALKDKNFRNSLAELNIVASR